MEDLSEYPKKTVEYIMKKLTGHKTRCSRWFYCKYCYKNIQPLIIITKVKEDIEPGLYFQIRCPICDSGLTEDMRLFDLNGKEIKKKLKGD